MGHLAQENFIGPALGMALGQGLEKVRTRFSFICSIWPQYVDMGLQNQVIVSRNVVTMGN